MHYTGHHPRKAVRQTRDKGDIIRIWHSPHRSPPPRFLVEIRHDLKDDAVFAKSHWNYLGCRSERNIEQKWRRHTSLSWSMKDLEPFRELPVVHAYTRPHVVVELEDKCHHLAGNTSSGEHLPLNLSADRNISLLKADGAHA